MQGITSRPTFPVPLPMTLEEEVTICAVKLLFQSTSLLCCWNRDLWDHKVSGKVTEITQIQQQSTNHAYVICDLMVTASKERGPTASLGQDTAWQPFLQRLLLLLPNLKYSLL